MEHIETFDLDTIQVQGPEWDKNARLGKGESNCLVCNRRMKYNDPRGFSVHMTVDGKLFPADREDLQGSPLSQGHFEVGSACAKKIPSKYLIKPVA